MPKWPLVRRDQLSLLATAVNSLLLAVPPACPDQLRGLATREPTVPRRSFWRQRDPHESVVKVLLGVMIDRGAQGLEVGAGTTGLTAFLNIGAALGGSDLGQHLAAPIVVQPTDASFELRLVRHPRSAVFQIDRQHVGDVDPVDIAGVPGWASTFRRCRRLAAFPLRELGP